MGRSIIPAAALWHSRPIIRRRKHPGLLVLLLVLVNGGSFHPLVLDRFLPGTGGHLLEEGPVVVVHLGGSRGVLRGGDGGAKVCPQQGRFGRRHDPLGLGGHNLGLVRFVCADEAVQLGTALLSAAHAWLVYAPVGKRFHGHRPVV